MSGANPKALAALVFTVLIWGLAPALVRGFSLTAGPWDSMFIRLTSVALICIALLPFSGWRIARKDWLRMIVVSCIGIFGYFVGSIFGFAYIGAGPGGLIFATQPLIIAVLASVIGLERLTPSVIFGFAVSFAGTLFLLGDDLSMTGSNPFVGALFIFGACLAFGINVVLSKPLAQAYGAFRLTNVTMILSAIPALLFYRPDAWTIVQSLDWKAWASLIYLGPVGTILAVVTWNYAVAHLRPSTVGGSMYVVPVLALIAGMVMLGEPLTLRGLVAGAVIIAGVAIAEFLRAVTLPRGLAGVLAISFAVIAWGFIPVGMRHIVLTVSPDTAILLRLIPAGLVASAIALWVGWPRLSLGEWLRLAGAGLGGNLAYQVLAAYGMALIPAAWTGMLFGLEPIFIALFAVLFLGERLNTWIVLGLLLAVAGTAVLVLSSSGGTIKDVNSFGVILVTISTLGWAIYTTLIRPITLRHGATVSACMAVAIGSLPSIFMFDFRMVSEATTLDGGDWLIVGLVSVVATTLATMAWNFGLQTMSNARAGMFLYVQPLVAAAGGVWFLNESISGWLLAGGVLIFAGVAISEYGGSLISYFKRERLMTKELSA